MKKESSRSAHRFTLVVCAAVLPVMVGCYSSSSRSGMHEHAPSGYVEGGVFLEDDYVYYPGYEVYYSSRRHNYVYLDGRNWVTHETPPPRVQVNVLQASPSVRVDFHDAPAQHHATVVRQYPRNWKPAERRPDDHKDGQKGDGPGDHKDGSKADRDNENGRHN